MKQGPNVKRLIVHKMALLTIPPDCANPLGRGANAIATSGELARVARAATAWVEQAIAAVRRAAEPNPWKDADDEAIAGEIMRQAEERKRARRTEGQADGTGEGR